MHVSKLKGSTLIVPNSLIICVIYQWKPVPCDTDLLKFMDIIDDIRAIQILADYLFILKNTFLL